MFTGDPTDPQGPETPLPMRAASSTLQSTVLFPSLRWQADLACRLQCDLHVTNLLLTSLQAVCFLPVNQGFVETLVLLITAICACSFD